MRGEIKEKISAFLTEELLVSLPLEPDSEQINLLQQGLLDSYGFVQVITFLESTFGIHFTDEEIITLPLFSLKGMCDAVRSKLNANS